MRASERASTEDRFPGPAFLSSFVGRELRLSHSLIVPPQAERGQRQTLAFLFPTAGAVAAERKRLPRHGRGAFASLTRVVVGVGGCPVQRHAPIHGDSVLGKRERVAAVENVNFHRSGDRAQNQRQRGPAGGRVFPLSPGSLVEARAHTH